MTPSSPDEALHFRGKTLTPESPRPLHIAEPANIPVLQNQMDPVFNDTSTYETSGAAVGNFTQVPHHDGTSPAPHAGSAHAMDNAASVRGSDRPQQTQGSSHSGSFQTMNGTRSFSSFTASLPQASPADHSAPFMATATPSGVQTSAANSSLTTFRPSDPATYLAHPVPDVPSSSSHPQSIPTANEVDPAVASWTAAPPHRLDTQNRPADNTGEDGVDFQNLLDNLPPPSTAAPPAPAVMEMAPSSANDATAVPHAASDEALQSSLGLPPRPPPQEKPSIHPNYYPNDDIRSYHQLPPNTPTTSTAYPTQQSNYQSGLGAPSLVAAGAPGTSSGASTLPPPPVPSFQQSPTTSTDSQEPSTSGAKNERTDGKQSRPIKGTDEDAPWGPEVQKKYDEFLHNERIYVTEGLWDRFPSGSRLFVGNLPTERVTKRDLFHIFHKYGKLAQISIKQAYGFIQFLDSSACKKGLDAEQGAVIRGRKVHLEISKPQRNTRPGPPVAESSRAPPPRRSRSPEFSRSGPPPASRNPRPAGDRYDRPYEPGRLPFSDFRDEPTHRRRDDYRPPRSPSPPPRGFRGRDGYRSRDRTPERFDRRERRRSRSPFSRDRRYRSLSPRARSYDGDADLPVPRRNPRDVPEVQVLVLEEVDRNFIFQVENAFRNRGLRVDILVLGPRIPLNAAVQRQISEGVLAVVRLSRPNQFSRKIPLQVFDRSGGAENVRFNEYPDVEPSIAAEIVFHAQSVQRGAPPTPFPPNIPFAMPPMPPAPIPQAPMPALSNPPNIANMITSLDGPTLQSLLGALQQRPPAVPTAQQPPFPAAASPQTPADLASLLSAATRQPVPAGPQQPLPPQPFPIQTPNAPVVSDPNLLSLLTKGLGGQQHQNQTSVAPHVQNIMNQLGKWKQ
ncbi:putative RNA-binding protein (Nab3) [Aspergillus melleus]|uniref:putative RNA-binding protein (Nab3) n=1 Tax=Aspergillus melleus TaxID=138277 RepID=UPI001E8D3EBD|nr:nuclear polyadenylated RNA-binding protein 3 [Aspergillus melleus]KAH8423937.1 nuclear polyadenylated RNA-binding protein 3 [Aspergillus melleus]